MLNLHLIRITLLAVGLWTTSNLFGDIIDDLEDSDEEEEVFEKADKKKPKKANKPKTSAKQNRRPVNQKDLESPKSKKGKNSAKVKSDKNPAKVGPTDQKKKKPVKKVGKKKKKPQTDAERKKLPIELKSDGEAVYSRNGGTLHVVDNVRISQGNLFFRSDQAKAFFVYIDGERVADKVEILGNVKFAQYSDDPAENVKASGDKAIYLNGVGIVTLIGNARLWQGGHLIRGRQISYEVATGVIKIDQAQGIMQPEGQ